MEEAVCFKCNCAFVSDGALEVHLRRCDARFEPRRSSPWAFIPPPDMYGPVRQPRSRHPWFQNPRHQVQAGISSDQQRPAGKLDGSVRIPFLQRGDAARCRTHPIPGHTTTAKCTKCDLSFPDSRSLAEHFAKSPAHPYSAPPPSNSWDPPTYKTQPDAEETQPLPVKDHKGRDLNPAKNEDTEKEKITCECGKTFETSSALAQHKKNLGRHRKSTDSGLGAGKEGGKEELSRTPEGEAPGDDEVDDMTFAFTKLFTA